MNCIPGRAVYQLLKCKMRQVEANLKANLAVEASVQAAAGMRTNTQSKILRAAPTFHLDMEIRRSAQLQLFHRFSFATNHQVVEDFNHLEFLLSAPAACLPWQSRTAHVCRF